MSEPLNPLTIDAQWQPLALPEDSQLPTTRALGQRTTPRDRSHLPEAHEQRPDAVHADGPVMRVTWRPIPRLENPAHQHLITQESSDGARSKMYLLNHIARSFGADSYEHLYWPDLTSATLNTIMAMLRDHGYKESTRNAYLAVLKGTAKEAWTLGQMRLESYEKIRAVKRVPSRRIRTGRARSLEMLMDLVACERSADHPHSRRNALLLEMLIFTGMRRQEIRNILVPDHIFFDRQDILVQGKGGKDRWAKLPDEVWDELVDYIAEERGWEPGALFCAYWNRRRSPKISHKGLDVSVINRMLTKAVKRYISSRNEEYHDSVSRITPHDIRRSFATALNEMGHSVREIQVMLGHASIETTEGYFHDDHDAYRDKVSRSMGARMQRNKSSEDG